MRVAVAVLDEKINSHFGQTKSFRIFEAEQNQVIRTYEMPAFGEGHEAMISCLQEMRANVLICGGIGAEAKKALGEVGILVFGGIIGKADDAVRLLLEGKLQAGASGQCDGKSCEGHCAACGEHCDTKNQKGE